MEKEHRAALDQEIQIRRTDEFVQEAAALSEYLKVLPLSRAENDGLIELIVKQVVAAERGAFAHGFSVGAGFEKCTADDTTH